MNKLYNAAGKAIKHSLKVKRRNKVLLVTDMQKMPIAEALAYWCKKVGAETTTYLMTETLRPIEKQTSIFEEMIKHANITLYMLESRIQEKPFRYFMVEKGGQYGRICMMPGITVDMMERLVNIDFSQMAALTKKVINKIKNAKEVHVTNAQGTDLTCSIKGRKWIADIGDISKKGSHGNLPAGEAYTCPVEKGFTGKIVLSLIDDAVGKGVIEFKDGKVTKFSGKGVNAVMKNIGKDSTGKMIGEFGIGTNKGAKICKNMLEAEKAFGTCHFAIGDSYGLGKNKSKHHYDALVEKVTIEADGKFILKNGKFMI